MLELCEAINPQVRKHLFFAPYLYIKTIILTTIILPRQARDANIGKALKKRAMIIPQSTVSGHTIF
eukprot:COSAG06_NODE_16807_length_979_cov_6.040909_1_plen_65_part_10